MKKIILLSIFIMLVLTGCSSKVEVPVYVHNKTPLLENYDIESKYDFGTLTNKNNTVCIQRWNTCMPKNEFIILIDYMKDIKSIVIKHNNQIDKYNIWSTEQNKR